MDQDCDPSIRVGLECADTLLEVGQTTIYSSAHPFYEMLSREGADSGPGVIFASVEEHAKDVAKGDATGAAATGAGLVVTGTAVVLLPLDAGIVTAGGIVGSVGVLA
jgi:hypothetical protein